MQVTCLSGKSNLLDLRPVHSSGALRDKHTNFVSPHITQPVTRSQLFFAPSSLSQYALHCTCVFHTLYL